jgi:hypothetical protein
MADLFIKNKWYSNLVFFLRENGYELIICGYLFLDCGCYTAYVGYTLM